jgi:hypothetical protein
MAYYTETVKDKKMVWEIILLSHSFVIIFLLPLFSNKFSFSFSTKIIKVLNIIFGKSKKLNFSKIDQSEHGEIGINSKSNFNNFYFVVSTFISGFMFSFSITFLYYLSFSYPQKALTLSSYSQILNMFGVLLQVLLIDPRVMSSIDKGKGSEEIKLLTTSRIFVHLSLIILLTFIR